MADYESVKLLHRSLPAFQPSIPVALLPYLAFTLLSTTFALTFWFSTMPKNVPLETLTASLASVLGGFGVVALFCTVGVYV
ncbi:hypothetical protein BD626DRAFT_569548 [Schizophyllum amplum]|uniref:Dolichyl-diphosphooligosaccharide-protein glycosyltransferase subunit OST5 n=1 Tax=Schizophyllum amplum TaxID=97359 RepID=A0A550CDV2_9AGAR|nr:hypothetical protein BD626DRAFT_574777 [Auriculariopsis ampla]TRM62982.1 hypothetical protein BD626DRAFT_569548 [Auriculariopsis ampla]